MAASLIARKTLYRSQSVNKFTFRLITSSSTSEDTRTEVKDEEINWRKPNILYDGHLPTSTLQKILLSIGSAGMALYKPQRDDMVAVMGETTGVAALKYMHYQMSQDIEGQTILRDQPRINSQTVDLSYLKTLPENTLGRAYLKFLNDNKVSPDTRMDVRFVDDIELAYVMQRYREVHDLMHTMLDMPTNMLGEVAVKWIEGIQTRMPMCVLGGLFGPLRFAPKQRRKYLTMLPWCIRCGYQSRFLMNIYYEKRWEEPIDDIRKEMNIELAPQML